MTNILDPIVKTMAAVVVALQAPRRRDGHPDLSKLTDEDIVAFWRGMADQPANYDLAIVVSDEMDRRMISDSNRIVLPASMVGTGVDKPVV